MKLTIRFKHNDSDVYPCACLVNKEGEETALACGLGKTWAEAEAEAIAKAKAMLNVGEPPSERIIEL